ncbi:hypothetical protein ABSA28_00207 [Candidatus Hepatincolaceae symbiont of Richtersius coronifer]
MVDTLMAYINNNDLSKFHDEALNIYVRRPDIIGLRAIAMETKLGRYVLRNLRIDLYL